MARSKDMQGEDGEPSQKSLLTQEVVDAGPWGRYLKKLQNFSQKKSQLRACNTPRALAPSALLPSSTAGALGSHGIWHEERRKRKE